MKLTHLIVTFTTLLLSGISVANAQPEPQQLRILTYNIKDATCSDVKTIAAVINSARPDIVMLQELDMNTRRNGIRNTLAEIGGLTNMSSAFGRAIDFDGGQYGIGVMSRFGFESTANHPLPAVDATEDRTLIYGKVRLPWGDTIVVASTHLDNQSKGNRDVQATAVSNHLTQSTLPTIVAGDFNARPDSGPIKTMETRWDMACREGLLPTCPSINPRGKIDYIFTYPQSAWKVVSVEVLDDKEASDHRPLLVVLELTK